MKPCTKHMMFIVSIILLTFAVSSCDLIQGRVELVNMSMANSEVIKIGVMAPMSGPASELGEHIRRGVELANHRFGNRYEILYEDDKCTDTKSATSAALKLADFDQVDVVIGPLCAPAYQAAAGIFNDRKVSFLHTSGSTKAFMDTAGKFGVSGLTTTIEDEDTALAGFIFNRLNLRRMAILSWDQEWAQTHREGFKKRFKELGGEIVFDESFELEETDFKTGITKLREAGAQGVFIIALNFQDAGIVKQVRDQDKTIKIFGQFEIEDPAFLKAAGASAEGIAYAFPSTNTIMESARFRDEFQRRYGTSPNYYSAIAYDALVLADLAMDRCGKHETECITQHILKSRLEGASGMIEFRADGSVKREFEIRTFINLVPQTIK